MEGIGWLEAWGTSQPAALAAWQALAARRMAEAFDGVEDPDEAS